MKETRWTPGPWAWGINPKWSPASTWSMSRELVVRPAGEFPHGLWIADCGLSVDDEQVANARLIAAAPKLYAALRAMVDRWEPDTSGTDRVMWENACAALAEAEGNTP